ncbi:MAG TPA: lipase maturation factor family protein [Gammaproteobacteria bacterium]|nr:lipase maturation factor family protein [Gammaproteobacteria bacterium]
MSELQSKPRLIYDGDCGYCIYSVNYWHALTRQAVDYQPYQAVAAEYPHIPLEAFKRAVQYIAPNGEVSSAAKASFLTLSHAPGHAFWWWLYRYLPGFAWVAEMVYWLVSKNRDTVYFMCRLCWGSHFQPSTYQFASWLFLRAFALIFLSAFVSFSGQAAGLIGSDGITPIAALMQLVREQLGASGVWLFPSVFWLNSSDVMINVVCKGGILFSLLLFFNIRPRLCLLFLYLFYVSLIYAGQAFMAFQWDLLLLEISMIAIVLSTERMLGIWLLRWLLFRFILASGLVKLVSGDLSWWNFTALNYHFYTQPLPTPLAWYAQQLPETIKQFFTFMTLVIEIGLVFLIFLPRRLRFIGGFSILLLQIVIFLTGNYNFFNLTAMALCLPLYDDAALKFVLPSKLTSWLMQRKPGRQAGHLGVGLSVLFAIVTVTISVIQFGGRFGVEPPALAIQAENAFAPLRWVNLYGPFANMTKARHEIILEGSLDGIHWYAYEFKYKPGEVNGRLKWNVPFQPRLDWQMWFAALSEPQDNPWFYRMLERLLQNSPSVSHLLAYNPFAVTGPRYIRSRFYDYEFTNVKERRETGAIWKRALMGEYLPSVQFN